jgi:hypothetical protein
MVGEAEVDAVGAARLNEGADPARGAAVLAGAGAHPVAQMHTAVARQAIRPIVTGFTEATRAWFAIIGRGQIRVHQRVVWKLRRAREI